MGQPKKKTTRRRTGNRRSHLMGQLARQVNRHSPVKVSRRTRRQIKRLEQAPSPAQPTAKAKSAKSPTKPPASSGKDDA